MEIFQINYMEKILKLSIKNLTSREILRISNLGIGIRCIEVINMNLIY